jgi:cytochrome c nitrite reductase small subunit
VTLPGVVLCILMGTLVGAGTYTAHYAEAGSYLSDDPKACMNCHIMRESYEAWSKSSHHAVATCNDCHTPHDTIPKYLAKARNGFWHSKGFTLNDFHEPIRIHPENARILNHNCVTCHAELTSQISPHAHGSAETMDCVHCHRGVGHGPSK